MPIPVSRAYGTPQGPPPIPPRRSNLRGAPPLPPRITSKEPNSRKISFATEVSKLSINSQRSIDFDGIMSRDPPLEVFGMKNHELRHPSNLHNDGMPVETNKFYGNMLIGSQTNPIWTHPYSLWWSKDSPFLGIAVAHIKASQRVFGPGAPPQYFFNPIGIKSFVFSCAEYATSDDFSLSFTSLKHMSAQVFLSRNNKQYIHFPLVQGMGFVTAIYHNLVPKLYSAVGFRRIQKVSRCCDRLLYEIVLENDVTWMLYITGASIDCFEMALQDGHTLCGSLSVSDCTFQIVASDSANIGSAAGCYPTDCELSCSVSGGSGVYSFNYRIAGTSTSGKTLMFCLPHHVTNFSDAMRSQPIVCQLDSTIKGLMNGYITNFYEMKITIPDSLEFLPFTTISNKNERWQYSEEVLQYIKKAAAVEVKGDVLNESNLDSMYFSGKILAKYAWILYCCQYIIKAPEFVSILLPKLKEAIGRFVQNTQILPLAYDKTWGGLISSGSSSQDFGNSFYNDHHFHYSYHVITAAILAKVDEDVGSGEWLSQNRTWVENLIRDFANPSEKDRHFPAFRSFDWFNGHSFAKGLFESGDGKDQESSSEDVNASYALKLWGLATNNKSLIELSNVQLGILRTSVNSYFLYSDDNKVMPPSFVPNKVSGILFENKVDHTTYFGNELQYIQMIHAIPITPASSFVRTPRFVEEEWKQKLVPILNDVKDGWKGIIMLNAALFNPQLSFEFFTKSNEVCLDNGQSLTWSLAYSGAFL